MNDNSRKQRVIIYQLVVRYFSNTNTTNKPWGTIVENGCGKFNEINDTALGALKDQGYTHIWFTGVLEHATLTDNSKFGISPDQIVKGRAGSPYAIKDYYDVDPDLAENVPNRLNEFADLIRRTHNAGLKAIIDFVPNHVARTYQSDMKPNGIRDLGDDDDTRKAFLPNNNFYYLPNSSFTTPKDYKPLGNSEFLLKNSSYTETPAKVSGNDVFSPSPSISDWFETVKLNYGVDYQNGGKTHFHPIPDTWKKMKAILLYWIDLGVDGFRCDMAEMVPVAFWSWAIGNIKKDHPEVDFLAEIYNPQAYRDYIHNGKFDYLYDKVELYDTVRNIIQNNASTDDITPVWQGQEGIEDHMLRFLENHDEQRIASSYFAGDAWKGIPMMALISFMHRGPVMVYYGQEVGEPGSGVPGYSDDDGRTTIFDYWGVPEHIKWVNRRQYDGGQLSGDQKELFDRYGQILRLCNSNPAIQKGSFYDLHFYNRNDQYQGYSNKVFAFLRYHKSTCLLIIINFSTSHENADIRIPEDAWKLMGITGPNAGLLTDEKEEIISRSSATDPGAGSQMHFALSPLSYEIIQITLV